jgi:endonuclease/exonuclease/phosphatase family metal-dependent hydrolase
MPAHYLAFWNVENLFAPENHPSRIPWIARKVAADLAGWTEALYRRKIDRLAHVIAAMNGGAGPDILGVCEIEDRTVLEHLALAASARLPGRTYGIVHADNTRDMRGIDTAFLFDTSLYTVDPALIFNHFVIRRTGTRDITQATFHTTSGRDLVILCNHWPSRTGGAAESAGFRATAGETLGYWHERIREEVGADAAVIAFGDFNDDPFDPSIRFNANAWRERGDVERADSATFYNLAWEYLSFTATDRKGNPRQLDGTLYFKSDGNVFDQILVGRPLLDRSRTPFKVRAGSAAVFTLPEMVDNRVGAGPIRFGLPKGDAAKNVNADGFSDHFPVTVIVDEAG